MCLNGGRFRVEVDWVLTSGRSGSGTARPLTEDTGLFWFFDEDNIELVVKILDGRNSNHHFWVFYGALSNVGYTLKVTDTRTGRVKRYRNPRGRFASRGDTEAFPAVHFPDPPDPQPPLSTPPYLERESAPVPNESSSSCRSSASNLCLNDNRFRVEVDWVLADGRSGRGIAKPLTNDTGYFWFFNQSNVELVVKALDGRPVNGNFWIFYGALSNVEYTLKVTDTQTGKVKRYRNPRGRFASRGETRAFPP